MLNQEGESSSGSAIVDAATRFAMRQYSRRGVLSAFGRAGLLLAGAAAGLGLPAITSACTSPPPECFGPCEPCNSACIVQNQACQCTCPVHPCLTTSCHCFYAHGVIGSGCGLYCECPSCTQCT